MIIDKTLVIYYRCANGPASEVIQFVPPKPKKIKVKVSPKSKTVGPTSTPSTPQILQVWSCKDSNLQPGESVSFENITRSIKSERVSLDGVHYTEEHDAPPSIDMSAILTDNQLSSQLLTLMDADVCSGTPAIQEIKPNLPKLAEGNRTIVIKKNRSGLNQTTTTKRR